MHYRRRRQLTVYGGIAWYVYHQSKLNDWNTILTLPPSPQRADPNLIHWQPVGHNHDVQQEAREMIFAGTGHRPPSYTSNDRAEGVFDGRVEGVLEPEPAANSLPSVAERRAAGTVCSRGGTVRMARSS